MPFQLIHPQFITLRKDCVYYHHDDRHGVVLSRAQFANLDDVLYSSLHLMSYPLGDGAYLTWCEGEMRLQTQRGFFTFYRKSWSKYKRHVHKRIRFILYHGERTSGELHANDEVLYANGSEASTSTPRWYPAHRSARNARIPNGRWKKHASVSQRYRTNPRRRFRRGRYQHVSRIRGEDSRASTPNDNFQSSDECSLEEETIPIEDTM